MITKDAGHERVDSPQIPLRITLVMRSAFRKLPLHPSYANTRHPQGVRRVYIVKKPQRGRIIIRPGAVSARGSHGELMKVARLGFHRAQSTGQVF